LGSQKRDAEISTFVTLGKTKMDWGCDQPLDVIFEGLREICGQHGCDEGTAFSKEISWAGPGNFMNSPQPRTLQLHASGSFFGEKDRDIYIDAFKATATPETVGTEDRAWCKPTSNPRLGSCREVGSCPMRIFPNFIKIARFEGENLKDHIDVNVSTEGSNRMCSPPLYVTES
jgi:hypothetical protein